MAANERIVEGIQSFIAPAPSTLLDILEGGLADPDIVGSSAALTALAVLSRNLWESHTSDYHSQIARVLSQLAMVASLNKTKAVIITPALSAFVTSFAQMLVARGALPFASSQLGVAFNLDAISSSAHHSFSSSSEGV